jgi:Flp pilus assembly protein TadD
LKLAESLLAAGDWEEAARIYETIVKEHPDAAEAYYGIGRIRAANGDLTAAVESCQRACELFTAYGQTELLRSIDRHLRTLEATTPR